MAVKDFILYKNYFYNEKKKNQDFVYYFLNYSHNYF